MPTELQSVEASLFVQATEDEGRVVAAVQRILGVEADPGRELLEGHFGNPIVHVKFHLTGEEATDAFRSMVSRMPRDEVAGMIRDIVSSMDEHKSLYVRLSKQTAVLGVVTTSMTDPIRIKVKPRSFMIRGNPAEFYSRLVEDSRR